MNFDLDEEQRDLATAAADHLSHRSSPAAVRAALESGAEIRPGRADLVSSGFAAITVPEAFGGGGGSLLDLVVVAEQAGRVLAGPSLVTFARAAVLLDDDAERLSALAGGTAAYAVVEEAGPVLDAAGADTFLALRDGDLVCGTGAVTLGDPIDPTRGLGSVELGETTVLARDAGARWARAEQVARVVLAAEGLGATDRALELAVDYAKQRHAFGRAIGSYQAVKHALVDTYVELEQLRSLVWWAAWSADHQPGELALAGRRGEGRVRGRARAGRGDADPGPRRHRLHLGARRAPVLAPGQGRPLPAR